MGGCLQKDGAKQGSPYEEAVVSAGIQAVHDEPVFALCGGVEASQLCSGGEDKAIVVLDWREGVVQRRWKAAHSSTVSSLCCAGAVRLYSGSRDRTVAEWNMTSDSAEATRMFTGHELAVSSVCLSNDESVLCSGSRDCTVRWWDLQVGTLTHRARVDRNLVTSMRWLPREDSLLQASEDLSLRVWDARTMEVVQRFEGLVNIPKCCDVSEGGVQFATSHNGFDGEGCEVKIWDRRKEEMLFKLSGHTQAAVSCAYISENVLASGSTDTSIRIWDTQVGNNTSVEHCSAAVTCVASAPAGLLSAALDGSIQVWETAGNGIEQVFHTAGN